MKNSNKLEQDIFRGALKAQSSYEEMTGGWWLSHGPESIIQIQIALSLKKNHYVDAEASPAKILQYHDSKPRGRPSHNRRNRFDLVVWNKSGLKIRAVVEVKRAYNTAPLIRDAEKLRRYAANASSNDFAGYLLFYSEAVNAVALKNRIGKAAKETNSSVVGQKVTHLKDEEVQWSIALLRLNW
jgi:hypothetical protein